jgi:uncharacterized protein (DUF2147 family)
MKLLWSGALTSLALIVGAETSFCSPIGTWLAKDGAKIRISSCGRSLCGFLVQPNPPNDRETGLPRNDKNNIDPAKRSRSLAGIQILISMQQKSPGEWIGKLYNDDDGNTYPGKLIEVDRSSARIEGCSLGICGGETITRLK